MKKIISLLLILIVFTTFFSQLTVVANASSDPRNTVRVSFKSVVDPRVKNSGQNVMIGVFEKETGYRKDIYLYAQNNYTATEYLIEGDYIIYSAMVLGDFELVYDIETPPFKAEGLSIEVILKIGDVDYDGPTEDPNNNMIGDIDHDKTNELLEEDNKPTINWQDFEDARDANKPYDPNNKYMPKPDSTTPTEPDEPTEPNATTPNGENNPTTPTNPNKNDPSKSKTPAFIVACATIGIFVFAIYLKFKKTQEE